MKCRRIIFLAFTLFGLGTALADAPFRNHRYDAFKVLKLNSDNIVFIGNSITNMHEWWEAFGDTRIVNRGVSGAVSDEVVANLESMITGKPGKVFLMIGTNDLGTAGINNAAHVAANTRIIVKRIRKESPSTQIYVQSILPSARRDLEQQIQTNDSLRAICKAEGATYIDLWDALYSVSQNNEHSLDYLHLCASGYHIWCKAIAEHIGTDCTYPENGVNQTGGIGGSNGMRTSTFGFAPVRADDILLIGDEMVSSGEWHELLGSGRVKNRGTGWGWPGLGIADVTKQIPVILKGRPDNVAPERIFLYVGTADVNGTADIATLKERYEALVRKVKELAPHTPVFIQALLPMNDATKNATRVEPFNNALKAIADANTEVTYVDIYTPLLNGNVANTAYFSGNYLDGKGYVEVARILAGYMGGGVKAVTREETDERYDLLTARNNFGANLGTVINMQTGHGIGQIPAGSMRRLFKACEKGYALLADETLTVKELNRAGAAFSKQKLSVLENINRPRMSEAGKEYWYKLYTPNRNNRYMTSNGAGCGVTGNEIPGYASIWKFQSRPDGTCDIINRADGSYLNPVAVYNTQVKTSSETPQRGWTLSYANAPGTFIISSGNVQLNQTAAASHNNAVFNWSTGQTGADRDDIGCQYTIADVSDTVIIHKRNQ